MKRGFAVLAVLVFVAFASTAQEFPRLIADVPFQFLANGKLLPAGNYEFQANATGAEVTVRTVAGKNAIMVPTLTRLGERGTGQSEVVFDKVGEQYFLAEMHISGVDGFAFQGAPGKHTHVGVKPKK